VRNAISVLRRAATSHFPTKSGETFVLLPLPLLVCWLFEQIYILKGKHCGMSLELRSLCLCGLCKSSRRSFQFAYASNSVTSTQLIIIRSRPKVLFPLRGCISFYNQVNSTPLQAHTHTHTERSVWKTFEKQQQEKIRTKRRQQTSSWME